MITNGEPPPITEREKEPAVRFVRAKGSLCLTVCWFNHRISQPSGIQRETVTSLLWTLLLRPIRSIGGSASLPMTTNGWHPQIPEQAEDRGARVVLGLKSRPLTTSLTGFLPLLLNGIKD